MATWCSQGVFSASVVALFWLPVCPCGSVFPRCVLCLCRGLVVASWKPWQPCVPKVYSPVVLWPCFGFLGALAALSPQGVFSGCAVALFWPPGHFGGLVFPRCVLCLGGLCSQGVFSACVVAWFWLPGRSGGSVFPRCVLGLRRGLVLASWTPWQPCVPKVWSVLAPWPCVCLLEALAALRSQGVFSVLAACIPKVCSLLCGGLVLAS